MSCLHPLKRWVIGYDSAKDQEIAKITSYNTAWVYRLNGQPQYKFEEIPCGKCLECRLEYARTWAIRCMLEAKKYEHNEMLTLTYDDSHLPKSTGVDQRSGEYGEVCTLRKKDVQDFLKRLRKAYSVGQYEDIKFEPSTGIRYFMCGEYGEKNGRAHYHLIMYNLPVPDKKFGWYNNSGNPQMTSELIQRIWGKGLISLCPVTYESCEYVARYVTKKQKGPTAKESYKDRGQVPEYTCMSRKPGIAHDYYTEKGDIIYETQEIWISTQKTIKKAKPPRYFDKLFDIDNPIKMEEIKLARKELAKIKEEIMLQQTSISRTQYLENKEVILKQNMHKKVRQYEREQ